MKAVCNGNIDIERQELLDIYKLKGYRRYGNIFKAKYNHKWKSECTLTEFVWNYCKTPSYAGSLIDFVDTEILDDQMIKKWLTNINVSIDPEITYVDFEDGVAYLNDNPDEDHVHVLGEGTDLETPLEGSTRIVIDESEGDLFHGIIFESDSLPAINHVRFVFDTPNGEYQYIFSKNDLKNNVYVLQGNEEDDSDEDTVLYYVPFFKHPIPLVHLAENQVKLSLIITLNSDEEPIDCRPLLTLLCAPLKKWLKKRNLLLGLRDDDYLRVGPKNMRIIENYE